MELFHFSDDGSIRRFRPHVPVTNPTHAPAVWAIDADHEALYWFPRACPRIAVWPRSSEEWEEFATTFGTRERRLHVIESPWSDELAVATLYRYRFDATPFRPWPEATGQWIAETDIVPLGVDPITDLVGRHRRAGIELRTVDSLGPVRDLVVGGPWEFSMVRMANARGVG